MAIIESIIMFVTSVGTSTQSVVWTVDALCRWFDDHPDLATVVRGEAFSAAEIQAASGLPVLAQMRDQRGLAEAVDLGLGPLRSSRGPLARAVAQILGDPFDPPATALGVAA